MRLRLHARWVFPVAGPPIENGVVTIRGERIESVAAAAGTAGDALDLGNAAILPGLVNAHTHLEFSSLAEPLGAPGMPLADWIRLVVQYRRGRHTKQWRQAFNVGLTECKRAGAMTIGEITTRWPPSEEFYIGDCHASLVVFFELIGLNADQTREVFAAAFSQVRRRKTDCIRYGLSPHAPYTVHSKLLHFAAMASQSGKIPLAMHVAESREELELLATGGGPLRAILEEFGAWSPDAIPKDSRPLDYLQQLANANRALVIHGNYLTAEEIDFVAKRRDRMSIVYCPRTHERFGHSPYPLQQMLEAGALVALGTDSRASNPDLDLLAEMRHVTAHHPVSPATVLQMGTINGAKALGLGEEVGSLEPGKFADLAVVQVGDIVANDPFEALFDPRSKLVSTYCRGKPLDGAQY